jgi:hypothetical protein
MSLLREVDFKCANPGCANVLLDFHHLKEWHVHKTHDAAEMIAVCPTCHGHAHRGTIRIDDRTIRSWKSIQRLPNQRAHLYVEPGTPSRIIIGTLCLENATQIGATILQISPGCSLSYRVVANEIMLMNCAMHDAQGREVARIIDGYVESPSSTIVLESRPGRVLFTAPATEEFLPPALFQGQGSPLSEIVEDGRFEMLDLEVRAPGVVRARGVWIEEPHCVVFTKSAFFISVPGGFSRIVGYYDRRGDLDDQSSIDQMPRFKFDGPITRSLLSQLLNDTRF